MGVGQFCTNPGIAVVLDRPEAAGTLSWGPAFAEISPAGDAGWTTGPYEFRPNDEGQPTG